MNTREIEIRFALHGGQKEDVVRKLEEMGWEGRTSSQKDTYFCAEQFFLEKRTKDCPYVIRIREQGEKYVLAYKSFTGDGSWIELESGISDPVAIRDIFERLGQVAYLVIKKVRQQGRLDNVEVNVDAIEGLGDFVELEILAEDVEAGRTTLTKIAQRAGIVTTDLVTKGYVQLMEERAPQS